jgi:hypothetical protein
MFLGMFSSVSYQIEQRKQKDPNDIHKVPIEPGDLNRVRIGFRKLSPPGHEDHDRHDAQTDDHVNGMQAGHGEVEREKDLRLAVIDGI